MPVSFGTWGFKSPLAHFEADQRSCVRTNGTHTRLVRRMRILRGLRRYIDDQATSRLVRGPGRDVAAWIAKIMVTVAMAR